MDWFSRQKTFSLNHGQISNSHLVFPHYFKDYVISIWIFYPLSKIFNEVSSFVWNVLIIPYWWKCIWYFLFFSTSLYIPPPPSICFWKVCPVWYKFVMCKYPLPGFLYLLHVVFSHILRSVLILWINTSLLKRWLQKGNFLIHEVLLKEWCIKTRSG